MIARTLPEGEFENVIQKTVNYGQFRFDPLNRPVEEGRLKRLVASIQQQDLLHLFPIIVTRGLVIRDGQHRLRAAEQLNRPIYYIISDLMTIKHARQVTQATGNWTASDYLAHWCAMGFTDYQVLRDFCRQYDFISLMFAADILSVGERAGLSRKHYFEQGHFRAVSVPFAHKVAHIMLDFKPHVPTIYRSRSFASLVKFLASQPAYDHARMMSKMEHQAGRLTKQPDLQGYINIVNDIYNRRTRDRDKVFFFRSRASAKDDAE